MKEKGIVEKVSWIIVVLVLLPMLILPCRASVLEDAMHLVVFPGGSIQDAINRAHDGATIYIQKGVYVEDSYPIIVNKTVVLMGEGVNDSIVDGDGTERGIFLVKSDEVKIMNLTIRNTIVNWFVEVAGIQLADVKSVEVLDSKIEDCMVGVLLKNSSGCTVARNVITNNRIAGIFMREFSSYNLIFGNTISNNTNGMWIKDLGCRVNRVFHNNFLYNVRQTQLMGTGNMWDNGYPSGGNYWSNYGGADNHSGFDQDQPGSDGIGDRSYDGLDRYPLMGMIRYFKASQWNEKDYYVVIASDSTIADFSFDPNNRFIEFNAVGLSFCRVAIPKQLVWTEADEDWEVTVDDATVNPWIKDDSEYTYFYFTYGGNLQTIRIKGSYAIPEFSAVTVLAVLAFLAGIIILIRKNRK